MLCASQDLQPPRSIINEINWKDIESLGKSKQDTHEEQSIRETKLEAYTARSPTYMDFQVADFRTKEPQSQAMHPTRKPDNQQITLRQVRLLQLKEAFWKVFASVNTRLRNVFLRCGSWNKTSNELANDRKP